MKTPPVRWRDATSDASPELREVMDYACSAEPGQARVEALTAAVLAQLPAAAAPPAASTTAPHAAAAGAGAKLLVVSAIAAALGAGAWWTQRDAPARRAPDASVEAARQEIGELAGRS